MMDRLSSRLRDELATKSALNFLYGGDYYTVSIDYPRPFPQLYIAYGLGEAALQAMLDNDLIGPDFLSTISLRSQLEETIMSSVPEWETIVKRREMAAIILNNYSPEGAFNPN
jgi:hypothetical protein